MRRPLAALIVTMLGCAHGPAAGPEADPGDEGVASEVDEATAADPTGGDAPAGEVDAVVAETRADDDAPAAEPPPCITDPAEQEACLARGPGFSYGPVPYVYCSGVPPPPDHRQRHVESARDAPCVCNDDEAVRARIRACARVPRAAPPPPTPSP